jgi:hypothetical protein
LVYKIIQSSGLWRQPVVSHRCLASIHKLQIIRRTEHVANYRETHLTSLSSMTNLIRTQLI